jgi:hypothetical protein
VILPNLPWEQRRHLGRFRAYWRTVRAVTFRTSRLAAEGDAVTLPSARAFRRWTSAAVCAALLTPLTVWRFRPDWLRPLLRSISHRNDGLIHVMRPKEKGARLHSGRFRWDFVIDELADAQLGPGFMLLWDVGPDWGFFGYLGSSTSAWAYDPSTGNVVYNTKSIEGGLPKIADGRSGVGSPPIPPTPNARRTCRCRPGRSRSTPTRFPPARPTARSSPSPARTGTSAGRTS